MTQLDVAYTFLSAILKLHTGFGLGSEEDTSRGTEYFLLPDCLQQSRHCAYTATDGAVTSAVFSLPIKDTCCTLDTQFWNHMNKITLKQFSYGCNMKLQ